MMNPFVPLIIGSNGGEPSANGRMILSYSLAICNTPSGELYVASGGNFVPSSNPAYGYAYMLKNVNNSPSTIMD